MQPVPPAFGTAPRLVSSCLIALRLLGGFPGRAAIKSRSTFSKTANPPYLHQKPGCSFTFNRVKT